MRRSRVALAPQSVAKQPVTGPTDEAKHPERRVLLKIHDCLEGETATHARVRSLALRSGAGENPQKSTHACPGQQVWVWPPVPDQAPQLHIAFN